MDTPIHLNPRRLVRQVVSCDPQIPQYSAVLENDFPASQLRREVNRGVQICSFKHSSRIFAFRLSAKPFSDGLPGVM